MSNNQNDNENLTGTEYMSVFRMFDKPSIPTEIFAPDGTSIYVNPAMLDFNGAQDASLVVGKYNLLQDPVCNDELEMRDVIRKAFDGEAGSILDTIVPIEDLINCGAINAKLFEAAYIDYHLYPVMDGGKVLYVVFQFILKRIYKGQPDVARAKEYIDSHWLEKFDDDAVANAEHISLRHLSALFRQNADMTMGDYYKKVKVDHIKEKLKDKSLTVAQAFSFCGKDSRGAYAKIFKEVTGMSPTEYRGSLK